MFCHWWSELRVSTWLESRLQECTQPNTTSCVSLTEHWDGHMCTIPLSLRFQSKSNLSSSLSSTKPTLNYPSYYSIETWRTLPSRHTWDKDKPILFVSANIFSRNTHNPSLLSTNRVIKWTLKLLLYYFNFN